MKHKEETTAGTLILTTPMADALEPEAVLGIRLTDGWMVLDGLRLLMADEARPARARAAQTMHDKLQGDMRAATRSALRVV